MKYKVFAICFLLMLARGWERLWHAEFWAEEGKDFVGDAIVFGWGALFKPIMGSFYLIERALMTAIWSFLPHSIFPTVTTLVCYSVHAYVACLIVGKEYQWLVPHTKWRVFIALLLTLSTPGMTEMAGNVTNLNWVLFYWLALILMKDPELPFTVWQSVITLLVTLSTGAAPLLVPLAALRAARNPKKVFEIGPLVILLSVAAWMALMKDRSMAPIDRPVWLQLALLIESFLESAVYQPWIGDWPALALTNLWRPLNILLSLPFFYGAFYLFRKHSRDARLWTIAALLSGLFLWPYLCWLARPGRIDFFDEPLRGAFWRERYAFPLAVGAYFSWYVLFAFLQNKVAQRIAATFFILNLIWGIYRFRVPAYGTEARWKNGLARIEVWNKDRCSDARIAIYPDNWFIELPNQCASSQ